MTRIALELVRQKKIDVRRFETEIRETFESLKRELKDSFEDVVSDWDHQPTFAAGILEKSGNLVLEVKARGPNAKIFRFVDKGTRPHIIRPKSARRLRFQTGYIPHTQPGRAHTGPGVAVGPTVYASVVHHPGTEAREFTQTIADEFQTILVDEIKTAIREANR